MGDRYFRRGTSKFIHLATMPGAPLAPTQALLNAGIDLSPDVADWNGFTAETTVIVTPDLGTTFDTTIPGPRSAGNPTLTIYERLAFQTYWDLLVENGSGVIAFLPEGKGATKPAELWPIRVGSRYRNPNSGAEGATFTSALAITAEPFLDSTQAA